MKVKLRDLTKEQLEKWMNENCHSDFCIKCILNKVRCYAIVSQKDLYSDKFLDQEIEIKDETILTVDEKAYLEAVIKPFKIKMEYLVLQRVAEKTVCLYLHLFDDYGENGFTLPVFQKGTMYKRMKISKKYTLKELGLFEDDK